MDSLKQLLNRIAAWARVWAQKGVDYVKAHPRGSGLTAGILILLIVGLILPVPPPHVALSGEKLLTNGPDWFTNSLFTTILVDIIIIALALGATARMKLIPTGLQNFMEAVLEYLYNLSESVAQHHARQFFPWVVTIFIFVIISNWTGVLPGMGSIGIWHEYGHADAGGSIANASYKLAMVDGNLKITDTAAALPAEEGEMVLTPLLRPPSADLNTTFALALITIVMVQVIGVRTLGGAYWGKFFTLRGEGMMKGVNAFVGFLELVAQFSRLLAFGFRLFGNIFAGEVILLTMAFLIAFLLPLPFFILEIFVGFIQALVFMMLALVFFTEATVAHGDHEHH
ncbi:MAG: F0F1 ATP synthase subunit A [Litorilinea sp.]